MASRIHCAVEAVFSQYLRAKLDSRRSDARGRTAQKLFVSMTYFRRSFQGSATSWSGKVALATAFEMLLLDSSGAIRKSLVRRTKLLLKGVPGTQAMQTAVDDLYAARCDVVHQGNTETSFEIGVAREAYVRCFVTIGERLPRLNGNSLSPLGDLIGDV